MIITDFSSTTSNLWVSDGATVNLDNCSIVKNTVTGTKVNNAVISLNAVELGSNDIVEQDTILRLQQCTITGNTAKEIIIANNKRLFTAFQALIFSDTDFTVKYIDVKVGTTQPISEAPVSRPGITATSAWFVAIQEVCLDSFSACVCT